MKPSVVRAALVRLAQSENSMLKICKYGAKVLREKSVEVSAVTGALRDLANEMLVLMREAKGVGLAAEQVGRTERLCVIDIPAGCDTEENERFNAPVAMPLVMFNPRIVAREGSQRDKEGCLSFPGVGGEVTRARQVVCQFLDADNNPQMITVRGFLARAVQHETDHLDGVLYIDRMTAMERLALAARLKKLAKTNGGVR